DGEAPRAPVADMVGPLDAPARLLELHVAAGELAHRRGADEPGADPEAVCGALEQVGAVFPAWQLWPAVDEDAAVDGGAHVADDVRLHVVLLFGAASPTASRPLAELRCQHKQHHSMRASARSESERLWSRTLARRVL